MKRILQLIGLILICQGIGAFGALISANSVNTWYAGIIKPSFNPPDWIFGPVWTLLYIMMGFSCWLVTLQESVLGHKRTALILFGAQLLLNGIWSPLFFGLKNPGLALIDIIFLWVFIGLTVRSFWKVSKTAAVLLIPYWGWVSFATVLNFSIWRLN